MPAGRNSEVWKLDEGLHLYPPSELTELEFFLSELQDPWQGCSLQELVIHSNFHALPAHCR